MAYKKDLYVPNILVKKQYLYNLESGMGEYEVGHIISFNSYKGHQPTFDVLLTNGAVYSYLPIDAITTDNLNCKAEEYPCPILCPSATVIIRDMPILSKKYVQVFDRDRKWFSFATLIKMIEWPNDNELIYLVELNSAQLAFVPNHKILFTNKRIKVDQLPNYKKLQKEWK